ncbi:MAG: YIP1 family protein, partial [Proteobacteria bacterium]|nr:YIP1 family protein [Pseudomonadota bacterium]
NALILGASEIILIFALVWGMSLIISGVGALSGHKGGIDRAVRFVGYSVTPLLVIGIISCIPVLWLTTVLDVIAMPWAFIIMGSGVYYYLREKPERSAIVTSLLCGLLLILWTVLPLLIPQILSGIFRAAHIAASFIP